MSNSNIAKFRQLAAELKANPDKVNAATATEFFQAALDVAIESPSAGNPGSFDANKLIGGLGLSDVGPIDMEVATKSVNAAEFEARYADALDAEAQAEKAALQTAAAAIVAAAKVAIGLAI